MYIKLKKNSKHILIEKVDTDKKIIGLPRRYDLAKKQLQRKTKDGNWKTVSHQYEFFKGYSVSDIITEQEKFKRLINLSKKANIGCESLSTFITRLQEVFVYEGFLMQGINVSASSSYQSSWSGREREKYLLTEPINFYTKTMIKFIKDNEITMTRTVERMFKEHYDYLEKVISKLYDIEMQEEERKDLIEEFYSSFFETYALRQLRELTERYNYDVITLLKYIIFYLVPFENLDVWESMNLLRDYYSMADQIGRSVDKYPKYLKSVHDIIQANFESHEKDYDEERFKYLMRKNLEYEGKQYSIVIPEKTDDVIQEGTDLSHCVSSYVERILKGQTYIVFLRENMNKSVSLVTVEIKNQTIVQSKGAHNRKLHSDEKEFLKKYAREKNLGFST